MPTAAELLTSASGKMVLLNKLLPKLKADGHKARQPLLRCCICLLLC